MQFIQIEDNIPGSGCDLTLFNTTFAGCKCSSRRDSTQTCANDSCSCVPNYDHDGRLVNFEEFGSDSLIKLINECNDECECDDQTCMNRVVQNGVRFELEIVERESKGGRGVCTRQFIPAGSFVIEYLGELIGLEEAKSLLDERTRIGEQNYIMLVREHFNSLVQTTAIDAKNYSNLARLINHSCEPNMFMVPVRIGSMIPHAAFFACKDIKPGEELSYDYSGGCDDIETSIKSTGRPCHCEASNCRGYLPDLTIF